MVHTGSMCNDTEQNKIWVTQYDYTSTSTNIGYDNILIRVSKFTNYFLAGKSIFGSKYATLHYPILQYSTLHYTSLHYTTLHYTTLHYTTLHYTTHHCTPLHYTTLVSLTTLNCATVQHTALNYNTLHYNTLHCTR